MINIPTREINLYKYNYKLITIYLSYITISKYKFKSVYLTTSTITNNNIDFWSRIYSALLILYKYDNSELFKQFIITINVFKSLKFLFNIFVSW